jgi:hypothetical protein
MKLPALVSPRTSPADADEANDRLEAIIGSDEQIEPGPQKLETVTIIGSREGDLLDGRLEGAATPAGTSTEREEGLHVELVVERADEPHRGIEHGGGTVHQLPSRSSSGRAY